MTAPTLEELVNSFTHKVTNRLDESKLEGPVRLDPTRTIVIIPVKGKGSIFARIQGQVNDQGVQMVVDQIKKVPSLQGLAKE